jgi:DDE superfamily endonuclease
MFYAYATSPILFDHPSIRTLFWKRTWEHAQILLWGAILAPGKRTVTSALRSMGLSQDRHFENHHRVLNRARWSCLKASRILLHLVGPHR